MAVITIHDRADELRFEILGHFAGDSVSELATKWVLSLSNLFHRKFTVDISGLEGYDIQGRKLLYRMYRHGTQFACSTPRSLAFLKEISTPIQSPVVAAEDHPILKKDSNRRSDILVNAAVK